VIGKLWELAAVLPSVQALPRVPADWELSSAFLDIVTGRAFGPIRRDPNFWSMHNFDSRAGVAAVSLCADVLSGMASSEAIAERVGSVLEW
jgi:hypothetical protein